jgi:hypothetical protein
MSGRANRIEFVLPIVSWDEDDAEPPKKIGLRLDLRADRGLTALKHAVLQTEQTGQLPGPNPFYYQDTR